MLSPMSMGPDEARALLQARWKDLLMRWLDDGEASEELLGEGVIESQELSTDQTMAALLERLGEQELRSLQRITDALHRIDEGTFGRCIACGSHIDDARLRALPETPHCSECAEHLENPLPDAWTVPLD
jgi:RNA polymerase-binding transcription factor DksA